MVLTFAVPGMSHFVINVEHFASIPFVRPEPFQSLGFAVMTIRCPEAENEGRQNEHSTKSGDNFNANMTPHLA